MSTADSIASEVVEQWRLVPGHSFYEVSNLGRVRSWCTGCQHGTVRRKRPFIRKSNIGTTGYYCVQIAGKKNARVHRLVAAAFLGPSHGMEVNHKDGNKLNNRLSNLEYCSKQDNLKHARDTGLTPSKVGDKNPMARLTALDVHVVRGLLAEGFKPREIAESYGVHPVTIRDIKNGRTWRNS